MAGEPESIALSYARRLDEKVDRITETVGELKAHTVAVAEQLAGLGQEVAGVSRRIDGVEARLVRIEEQLDLAENAGVMGSQ